jgi:hypothetical protein
MIADKAISLLLALMAPVIALVERGPDGTEPEFRSGNEAVSSESAVHDPLDDMLAAMRGEPAELEAAIQARLAADAAAYAARVEAAIGEVTTYRPDTSVETWSEFRAVLDRLEGWAELIAIGDTHALDEGQLQRRALLRERLGRTQAWLFPRLREGLQDVEEVRPGIHCHTTADSYLVAICSGEPFQRTSEVRRFQYQMRTVMKQLRFRQVIYQAFASQPHNYYSDLFDPLDDSAVVIWQPSGQYLEAG